MMLVARKSPGVSPVIAVILLVAITVVLAAVLYLVTTQFAQNVSEPAPLIQLVEMPSGEANVTLLEVVAGSQTKPTYKYEAYLLINGSVDPASTLSPLQNKTEGNLTLVDLDGKLTSGDEFHIRTVPATHYKLIIFWRDSDGVSGSEEFNT